MQFTIIALKSPVVKGFFQKKQKISQKEKISGLNYKKPLENGKK